MSPDTPVDSLDLETQDQEGDGGALCGNGVTDPGEHCDDGRNGDDKDGCTDDCKFTCQVAGDCRNGEMCDGDETCDVLTHTCLQGEPMADGSVCQPVPRSICLSGSCIESSCGDGFVDAGNSEFCDPPGVEGCTDHCTIACTGPDDCLDNGQFCDGEEYCDTSATQECARRNVPEDGTECGSGSPRMICISSACQTSACGDMFVDTGNDEECDDGNDIDIDGCTIGCLYTCHGDGDCSDGIVCNGAETCDSSHVCQPGVNPSYGTNCDDGYFCTLTDICDGSGSCITSGDPCLDDDTCTTNEVCHEDTDLCTYDLAPSTCYINGNCYANLDQSPGDACLICNVSANPRSWTTAPNKFVCAAGSICCSGSCVPGLDCCVRTDCPVDSCQGTAAACSSFATPSGCAGQDGCGWVVTGTCSGTYNCNDVNYSSCSSCDSCYWNSGQCRGGDKDCSGYSQSNCTSCPRCTWTTTSENCQGTATACSTYTDPTLCNGQSGCTWTTYTCQNQICTHSP